MNLSTSLVIQVAISNDLRAHNVRRNIAGLEYYALVSGKCGDMELVRIFANIDLKEVDWDEVNCALPVDPSTSVEDKEEE